MTLLELDLEKFRNLSDRRFRFSSQFTLISGQSGSGKTSLLDAAAIALTGTAPGDEDVRLSARGLVDKRPTEWDSTRPSGGGLAATQTVFYASRGRGSGADPEAEAEALLRAAGGDEAARAALQAVAEVMWTSGADGPEFSYGGVAPGPWRALPGGARRLGALAAGLAARPAAVALIDELECGLHPQQQRRVIEDLQRVFPETQFLASTHSPFIIQSLHDGTLIDLDDHTPVEYPDLSIEDITELVLGVPIPQRSKRYLDMNAAATEAMTLLAQADRLSPAEKRQVKARLDELTMPFSTNQAFHAVLAMERLESGIDDEDQE